MHSMSKVASVMSQGYGHYTQFLNFQECFPSNEIQRAVWVPLIGDTSGSRFNTFSFLPGAFAIV